MYALSKKLCNFVAQFWKESPVKVHLAVLNWELECESPTVPQQWTPLWLLSINAIAHLGEKALGSGGKSEDQPFSVTCQTTLDVRAWGETNIFVDYETWVNRRRVRQLSCCLNLTIMQYIFIVAFEFVLAFTGVALLIRYYNHKA